MDKSQWIARQLGHQRGNMKTGWETVLMKQSEIELT